MSGGLGSSVLRIKNGYNETIKDLVIKLNCDSMSSRHHVGGEFK